MTNEQKMIEAAREAVAQNAEASEDNEFALVAGYIRTGKGDATRLVQAALSAIRLYDASLAPERAEAALAGAREGALREAAARIENDDPVLASHILALIAKPAPEPVEGGQHG